MTHANLPAGHEGKKTPQTNYHDHHLSVTIVRWSKWSYIILLFPKLCSKKESPGVPRSHRNKCPYIADIVDEIGCYLAPIVLIVPEKESPGVPRSHHNKCPYGAEDEQDA